MKKRQKIIDFDHAYHRLISVEWEDSQTTYGWQRPEDDDFPAEIKSIGFLVSDFKNCITLSSSISKGMKFIDKITIPKACIKKMRKLKVE